MLLGTRSRALPLPLILMLAAACSDGPLDVTPGTGVASVSLAPGDLALEEGATSTVTATARGHDGAPLTGHTMTWRSSDAAVATVSAAGLVTARAPGTAIIRASTHEKFDELTVVVHGRTVSWIQIVPGGGIIPQAPGTSRQLGVVARSADGTEIFGRLVTWTSSDPTVASVSPTGLLQAHAVGAATVIAVVDGRRDSVTVSVPTSIARVDVTKAELALDIGAAAELTAVARDASGASIPRTFAWTTSNPSVARVDASGRVTAVGAGMALITATSEGRSGVSRITVTGTQVSLLRVGGAALPAVLYTTTETVGGITRVIRFEASAGSIRVLSGGRYELRIDGWRHAEGAAATPATLSSSGFLLYDLFTGGPVFVEGAAPHAEPRYRGRFLDDGRVEMDWSLEQGSPVVALTFQAWS